MPLLSIAEIPDTPRPLKTVRLSSHTEQEELASADRVFSDTDPLVLIVSFSSIVAFAVCRSSLAGSVGIAVL